MADDVLFIPQGNKKTASIFRNKADINTYILSPKYGDPYQDQPSLARLYFSAELIDNVIKKLKARTSLPGFSFSRDIILAGMRPDNSYFDFFLLSIDEVFDEKFQITETLGNTYAVMALGKKPRIFTCSGALINSKENEWRIKFIYIMQELIGLSALSQFINKDTPNSVTLAYDSIFASGGLLNLRTSLRGDNELACPFAFSMLVTDFDMAPSQKSIEASVNQKKTPSDAEAPSALLQTATSAKTVNETAVDNSILLSSNYPGNISTASNKSDPVTNIAAYKNLDDAL